MNRGERVAVAAETVQIGVSGVYVDNDGSTISVKDDIANCLQQTEIIDPIMHDFGGEVVGNIPVDIPKGKIEIVDETTLDAAYSALMRYDAVPTILNFASAKHPGGGFQNGSLAQEEDVCYRSCLYAALSGRKEYYKESLSNLRQGLYLDKLIYTEGLVVIRDTEYRLSAPWMCNCITAPAPNRGAALSAGISEDVIDAAMGNRIENILKLAIAKGTDTIILGAFGCGVFKNMPRRVAGHFHTLLIEKGYTAKFKHIIFAIPGKESTNYKVFAEVFLN